MLKLLILVILSLLLSKQAYSQNSILDILNAKSCPIYSTMPDLDMSKVKRVD